MRNKLYGALKTRASLVLILLLIVSISINIRQAVMWHEQKDDYWVMYFEHLKFEDEVLSLLESGDIESAKYILGDSVKSKAVMAFIFSEEDFVSEEAKMKIQSYRHREVENITASERKQ